MAPGALLMLCVFSPVYAAGKAATSGVPSIYAPSTYAHLSPAKTPPPPAMIPMGPLYNGYSGDFDRNSSGEALGTARSSWWEVEGCREAGHMAIKGSGVGRGNWGQRAGGWECTVLLLTANLPQLAATAPGYPCFVTQTAA